MALLVAGCGALRGDRIETPGAAAPQEKGEVAETAEKAAEIATQPVRDLGVAKPEIPPVLVRATAAPYALAGLGSCEALAAEMGELTAALGPDFTVAGEAKEENKVAKVAEAGGKAVVNSIIPFRGVVRELTGAAARQRRLDDAIDAGFARRGFLHGVSLMKACPAPY